MNIKNSIKQHKSYLKWVSLLAYLCIIGMVFVNEVYPGKVLVPILTFLFFIIQIGSIYILSSIEGD